MMLHLLARGVEHRAAQLPAVAVVARVAGRAGVDHQHPAEPLARPGGGCGRRARNRPRPRQSARARRCPGGYRRRAAPTASNAPAAAACRRDRARCGAAGCASHSISSRIVVRRAPAPARRAARRTLPRGCRGSCAPARSLRSLRDLVREAVFPDAVAEADQLVDIAHQRQRLRAARRRCNECPRRCRISNAWLLSREAPRSCRVRAALVKAEFAIP